MLLDAWFYTFVVDVVVTNKRLAKREKMNEELSCNWSMNSKTLILIHLLCTDFGSVFLKSSFD